MEGLGRLPWSLSISHRGDWGFCALATDRSVRVGADIETVEKRDRALVRQFFTADEAQGVDAAAGREADRLVAQIWSVKEAALKAFLVGLRVDARSIAVSCSPGKARAGVLRGWTPIAVSIAHAALGPTAPEVYGRDEGAYVLSVALVADAHPPSVATAAGDRRAPAGASPELSRPSCSARP